MRSKRNAISELHLEEKGPCDIARLLGGREEVVQIAVKRFKEYG